MTGKQLLVMWLGISLIAAQFYFGGQWKSLYSVVGAKSNNSTGTPPVRLKIQQPGPL